MSLGLIHRRPVHPWAALREAERAFDRLQRAPLRTRRVADALHRWTPRLEAVETENGFEVTAEMPGVSRDDLELTIQESVLTLRGLRRYARPSHGAEAAADADAIDVNEGDERDAGAAASEDEGVRFERRIRFNADVDEANVSARYADGVLHVQVPKVQPPEPEVRTIPVQMG